MGPDPFNMPGAGAAGNSEALKGAVNQLAPLANTWSGPKVGPTIAQNNWTPTPKASGGVVSTFFHYIGNTANQIGHLTGKAAGFVGHQLHDLGSGLIGTNLRHGVEAGWEDKFNLSSVKTQSDQLSAQEQNLHDLFKSGKITRDQYTKGLTSISKEFDNLTKDTQSTENRISTDQRQAWVGATQTAGAIITIATTGLAGLDAPEGFKAAADFIAGNEADQGLIDASAAIAKTIANPELLAELSDSSKFLIQHSVAEVLANEPVSLTAGQISRAVAANVALKYPLNYWALTSSVPQIYDQLQAKQYGAAVNNMAWQAGLWLTGGLMGYATKVPGAITGKITEATFGQSAFFDEISKYFGEGNKDGFYNAIQNIASGMKGADKTEFIRNLSAVEKTNLNATGGDIQAAARRFAEGMKNLRAADTLTDITHEEAIQDMVKFAKWQRVADDIGKTTGKALTVGRVDARDLNRIAAYVTQGDLGGVEQSVESRLQAWEQFKFENPNQAWANNKNLDTQIKNLIEKNPNPSSLERAISGVTAQFSVSGVPKSVAEKMAKDGYFVIKPVDLKAPFQEGEGTIKSAFAQGDQFWTKTVQPLPVLSSVGNMLTHAGLSPLASNQRVFEIFNERLAQRLAESNVGLKLVGEDASQSADTMIKQLSNYAHDHTSKVLRSTPITDLRQLTKNDIVKALGVSHSDAATIQKQIARAMLDVPLTVRGLGDKAVDLAYPALRRYLRLQGAVRFSWNPFFQYMRVIPKTEFITENEGGGFFRSMFQGRLGEISNIRKGLREMGAFEEPGRLGNVVSQEATDYLGATGANLSRRLLPMQERSIAGLIDMQAQNMGMNWESYVRNFPNEVKDTVQAVAGYSRTSQFLNSPLARTLNVAIFPFRFEAKVLGVMTRSLGAQPLLTRVAVLKGLHDFNKWINTPEGVAWYSQNQEMIGLFKYISPMAELNQVFQSLVPGHDHSLGNFGEVGGLPFGFIPQLLDSVGLTNFNQVGVEPKTGAIYPQYIPASDRGYLAVAIQDLLGSLFSYPGATVGLPSKTSITRQAASILTTGTATGTRKNGDLKLTTPPASSLSTQQQNYINTLEQLNHTSAASAVAPPQAPPPQPIRVPAQQFSPTRNTTGGRSGSSGGRRIKKSQFRPALLPGQTKLGQL